MAEINKSDIVLFASQRLDDTTQGGGAMTLNEIVDGAVNNLFPDISRLDRVYGRVSLRKAFMSVQTAARPTYYGAHVVLTQQASDPRVGVSFFSTEDWFDIRSSAKSRLESYLAKGSIFGVSVYGHHFLGSRALKCITGLTGPVPQVGDVLVLTTSKNLLLQPITEVSQYVRVIDVSSSIQDFIVGATSVQKKVIDMTLGNLLVSDFPGIDISLDTSYTTNPTLVYTTVVADSARYYGILPLAEQATSGSLLVRTTDIKVSIVPSAQSQTAILDSGAGVDAVPLIQVAGGNIASITRSITYDTDLNFTVYLGGAVLPGSLSIDSGLIIDDTKGNLIHSSLGTVGSILYVTGIITWSEDWCPSASVKTTVYTAAAASTRISKTGQIFVTTNNRGFVYVYDCNPIPASKTLRVDYLSGGKWYSLFDLGSGELRGSDNAIGVGTVSYVTGSVSLTLGALPDADSDILFFWSESITYKSLAGYTAPFRYSKLLNHLGITPNSFSITWEQDGTKTITDDGAGFLIYNTYTVGIIDYAYGKIEIYNLPITPPSTTSFTFDYNYGEPEEEIFESQARDLNGGITLDLNNVSAIVPGTLLIYWENEVEDLQRDSPDKMISAPPKPSPIVNNPIVIPLSEISNPAPSPPAPNPVVESPAKVYNPYEGLGQICTTGNCWVIPSGGMGSAR